ncbi:MAG: lipid-A-disaccharide synthase [Kiritimatiellae bacterium]|nr:lipid-A-disaccharide synthase [Kiritimatiellia bacterium]
MPKRVCIIAGEVSGDLHAAALVRALAAEDANLTFFGTGGDQMRAAGVDTLYDVEQLAVMGISEVLRRYPFFRRMFKHLCRELDSRKPDILVLVDYPGFNLRFAQQAHRRGIKTVFYISPQVWAWKRSRIPKMAACLDHLITIFPFEARYFEGTSLPVTFAGNPLVDELQQDPTVAPTDTATDTPTIALLPGSRVHEIRRLLPVMLNACERVAAERSDVRFIIASASETLTPYIETQTKEHAGNAAERISVVTGSTRAILAEARAAWVASGTATVETALLRCPMVITYRVAPLTFALARRIVNVDHIGMVNIIAERRLCPEFVQDQATAENLATAIIPLIDDGDARQEMLDGLAEVSNALGEPGAAQRAATVVLDVLNDVQPIKTS